MLGSAILGWRSLPVMGKIDLVLLLTSNCDGVKPHSNGLGSTNKDPVCYLLPFSIVSLRLIRSHR